MRLTTTLLARLIAHHDVRLELPHRLIDDQMLFQRADTIENGWRAVQPFLDAWQDGSRVDGYEWDKDGPDSANELIERDGRHWHTTEPGQGPL